MTSNLDETPGLAEVPTDRPSTNGRDRLPDDDAVAYLRHIRSDMLVSRLYGKILPASLRSYLRRSTTPRLRRSLRQILRAILPVVAAAVNPIRSLSTVTKRRGTDIVIRKHKRAILATVVHDLRPLAAMRLNLELVRRSLDAYEVPYFLVRSNNAHRFRIAVPAGHRPAVLKALIAAAEQDALYVQRLQHKPDILPAKPRTLRRAVEDKYLRITRFQTEPTRCLVLGEAFGCELEFWGEVDHQLVAPSRNPCAVTIPRDADVVQVPASVLSQFSPDHEADQSTYPSRREFASPIYSDITFPIDVVYTWVNGSDPAWQQRRAAIEGNGYHPESANLARFVSHDELRYSLRSVHMHMPWIRNIYLVTDQQVPHWLAAEVPGLHVVDHHEIFTDTGMLPTFNSHAIETQLHHIDGLAEHFIYLNDDVCIGAPMIPNQFFLANGVSKFFPSTALVPFGEPTDGDIPSSAAGKNNRALIKREFGTLITHKMKHVAHALHRSVLYEIEERFVDAHRSTASNRLRDSTDISVTSSLHHYYAFHTGRAVPGSLRYAYYDLGAADTPIRLRDLLTKRNFHIFCVNATVDGNDSVQRTVLAPLLKAYFPVPSPFERPGA